MDFSQSDFVVDAGKQFECKTLHASFKLQFQAHRQSSQNSNLGTDELDKLVPELEAKARTGKIRREPLLEMLTDSMKSGARSESSKLT